MFAFYIPSLAHAASHPVHRPAGAIQGFQLACKSIGLIVKASPADKKEGVSYRLSRPLDALLIHHPGPKRGWPLKNNPDGIAVVIQWCSNCTVMHAYPPPQAVLASCLQNGPGPKRGE
jgi:hypothetical protein